MATSEMPYAVKLVAELMSEIDVLIKRLKEAEAKLQRLQFFTSDMNVNLENVTMRVIAMEQAAQRRVVDE